jgi:hypothetical protein
LTKSEIRWESRPVLRICKDWRQHQKQKQSLHHPLGTSIADSAPFQEAFFSQ